LIKSLPVVESADGSTTSVGNWLAATLPGIYGEGAFYDAPTGEDRDMNLSGRSNDYVAETFSYLFKRDKKNAASGGPPKVDAQVMAVALATYVTSETLASTVAQDYGFNTSADGIAYAKFNVLSVLTSAEATDLGLSPDEEGNVTIMQILKSTDSLAYLGLLYDTDDSSDIDDDEERLRELANLLFSAINEGSDI
jgi:hypothetical protein